MYAKSFLAGLEFLKIPGFFFKMCEMSVMFTTCLRTTLEVAGPGRMEPINEADQRLMK